MNFLADLAYLLSAFLFVAGLKQLSSPATARKGNFMASVAMLIAIVVTLVEVQVLEWTWIIVGIILGSLIGAVAARKVKMTAMPEMVGIFNGFGDIHQHTHEIAQLGDDNDNAHPGNQSDHDRMGKIVEDHTQAQQSDG